MAKTQPELLLVFKTCRGLQFAIQDRGYKESDIAGGIHYLNNLECDAIEALKNALQQTGFTNDTGEHRDLLSLAGSYAKIPEQQVNAAQQEITTDERLLLASQNFSFCA
ncbi:MAG: hypothetical protein AB7I18_07650 [Candidatus Berkiella sp.]